MSVGSGGRPVVLGQVAVPEIRDGGKVETKDLAAAMREAQNETDDVVSGLNDDPFIGGVLVEDVEIDPTPPASDPDRENYQPTRVEHKLGKEWKYFVQVGGDGTGIIYALKDDQKARGKFISLRGNQIEKFKASFVIFG